MPDRTAVQRTDGAEGDADHVVDEQQQVVVGRAEHRAVKVQVGLDKGVGLIDGGPQPRHGDRDRAALLRAGRLRGQPGRAGFERYPQPGERPDVAGAGGGGEAPGQHVGVEQVPGLSRADPGPGAGPALEQAFTRENLHAFTQRGPADVELAHQLVFGRHGVTGSEATADDVGPETVHDLSVPGPVWVGSGQRRSLRPAGYAIGAPTLRPALPASQHLHLMKFRVHAMKIDRRGGVILGSRESHTGASVPWPRRKR